MEITWYRVCNAVESLDMNKYSSIISVINKFQDQTPQVVKSFREEVLDKSVAEEDADVILGTVHASKGGEKKCRSQKN